MLSGQPIKLEMKQRPVKKESEGLQTSFKDENTSHDQSSNIYSRLH